MGMIIGINISLSCSYCTMTFKCSAFDGGTYISISDVPECSTKEVMSWAL